MPKDAEGPCSLGIDGLMSSTKTARFCRAVGFFQVKFLETVPLLANQLPRADLPTLAAALVEKRWGCVLGLGMNCRGEVCSNVDSDWKNLQKMESMMHW